jgi:hypothetical protein
VKCPAGLYLSDEPLTRGQAMGFFSKDIETLDDLFVHTLQDIHYAEKKPCLR